MGLLDNQTSEDYYSGETGGYRYISLKDIVNNFTTAYVGDGKDINYVSRADVLFHAKRGIQEFSYDISRVEKIQEVEVSENLSISMPQDYVSLVKMVVVDGNGIERPLYETRLTSKPSESPLQDDNGDFVYDGNSEIVEGDSLTDERYKEFDRRRISGYYRDENYLINNDYDRLQHHYGQRYGLNPETSQRNGVYIIDEANGKFSFSSGLVGSIVNIHYVSDGLGTDAEMKVHKFAEEAIYMHIAYNILRSKAGAPEYRVRDYKKKRRAAMTTAKIRLSKWNKQELTQTLRGQSKRIK